MTNANVTITPPTHASLARLRADMIRVQDLIQIGRAIAEGDDRSTLLINALEDLGRIAQNPRDGELNGALDDVADLARLDTAEMALTPADVRQLAGQAAAALPQAPTLRTVREAGAA